MNVIDPFDLVLIAAGGILLALAAGLWAQVLGVV